MPPTDQLTYRGTVYPWQCDHMGHMNVMWYTGKFDEATWQLFGSLGLTPDWLRTAGRGMAAVEQVTHYRRELLPGDLVSVHSRLLEVKEKAIRFSHEMRVDGDGGSVAATTILTGVFLDTALRKATPFPPGMASRWAELIER
ncbi:thioesterase family protein [Piscinibacter sp. XHJ-5]|uniref:acyl-CoA thioesterase n=1 Tax=Piscinibacter sp. XHJ-5 TaxID=3037797 RepID=UPI002452DD96|nr:thioesterase family protein [Piscinibacter sp. XHJ-5]